MTFIRTYSGVDFDLVHPRACDVHIEDIAYALSHINRFNGHVGAYSVAQHSVLVASMVPESVRLPALLHDAAEAYIGDVSTPVKALLGDELRELEHRIQAVICERFGISLASCHLDVIKCVDLTMLATERASLMPAGGAPWDIDRGGVKPLRMGLWRWPADHAGAAFLAMARDAGVA